MAQGYPIGAELRIGCCASPDRTDPAAAARLSQIVIKLLHGAAKVRAMFAPHLPSRLLAALTATLQAMGVEFARVEAMAGSGESNAG